MTITLRTKETPYNIMRQCGYNFVRQDNEELSFSRILGASRSGYPRFHIYIKVDQVSQQTFINLHLDQKKPIYRGVVAHSGEYDGEVVEKEVQRVKGILGL